MKSLPNSFGKENNTPILQRGKLKLKKEQVYCPGLPSKKVEEARVELRSVSLIILLLPNSNSELTHFLIPEQGPLGDPKKWTNADRPPAD